MRVQNPLTYGEKLLSLVLPNEHYTEARLEKMFGGSEININFPKNIWVHLTYQTAFVDEDGKLQLREDVYGRDARMIAILKGSERKVADIAIERAPNPSSKPVRMPIGMYGGNGGGYSGGGFFDFAVRRPRIRRRSRYIGRARPSAHVSATTDAIRSADRISLRRMKTPARPSPAFLFCGRAGKSARPAANVDFGARARSFTGTRMIGTTALRHR